MDDSVPRLENPFQATAVTDVHSYQGWTLARPVESDYLDAVLSQSVGDVSADEAAGTGNDYPPDPLTPLHLSPWWLSMSLNSIGPLMNHRQSEADTRRFPQRATAEIVIESRDAICL